MLTHLFGRFDVVKQRLPVGERKRQTLEAVTKVFAQRGFAATSAALARASGISEAMLYKLFGNKEGLYRAMIEHKLAEAGWGDFPVDPNVESERVFFTDMAAAIFAKVEVDPDFVRLLLYSDLQASEFAQMFHEALGGAVVAAVSEFIRLRIGSGALRTVDPEVTAVGFLCMTWQYAVGTKVFNKGRFPNVPDERAIETLVSLFLDGVAK